RCAASASPTAVFPAPGRPTRMRCGFPTSMSETICDVRKVAVIVPPRFRERIAAKLLERRLRQHVRRHRLGNDTHCRYCRNIAALGRRGRSLACSYIDRRQWAHERADGLHRNTDDQRLAGGHPALESTSTIRLPTNITR